VLKPSVINSKKEVKKNKIKEKKYYDRAVKFRNEFVPREIVLVKAIKKSEWVKGIIVKKLESPRSYLIKINNVVYRRNTFHLKSCNKRIA